MLTILCVMGKSPHLVEAHSNEVNGWQEKVPGYHNVDGSDYVAWFECDKKRSSSSSTIWFTLGYRITLQPIHIGDKIDDYPGFDYYYSTYSTPNNKNHAVVQSNYITSAIKKELGYVHNTNRIDTIHGLRQDVLRKNYNELASQYPHLVYREGNQVYAFLQPIIGVANKKNGGYYAVTDSSKYYARKYRSLGQWIFAAGWANSSTFKNHYNKKIPMPVEQKITVEYRAYNDGKADDGTAYKANDLISGYDAGSVVMGENRNLGGLGFHASTSWHGTTMQLAAVKIEQGKNERSGAFLEKAEDNIYVDNRTYGIMKSVGLFNTQAFAGKQVTIGKNINGFANALNAEARFTINSRGDNVKVIYYYGQISSKANFYYQSLFYGDVKKAPSAGQLTYLETKGAGEKFNRAMTDHVKSQISGKKQINRKGYLVDTIYTPFELTLSENSLADTKYSTVGNSVWGGSYKNQLYIPSLGQYDSNGKCTSKSQFTYLQNDINKKAFATFISNGGGRKYVFTGKYRSMSPTVVLKYFRKGDGSLSLFYAGTPQGSTGLLKELPRDETSDVTNLRYYLYGDTTNKAVATSEKYLKGQAIAYDSSRTANMHLTQAYVVDMNSSTSINGWGGSKSNCWETGMVTGMFNTTDGYGVTGTITPTEESRKAAMGVTSGNHTMTAVAYGQPMAMVFVYEESPEVTVRTYYSMKGTRQGGRTYNLYPVKSGYSNVTIDGETYTTSNRSWFKLHLGTRYKWGDLVKLDGSGLTLKEHVIVGRNYDDTYIYAKWARDGIQRFNSKEEASKIFGDSLSYSSVGTRMSEDELNKYVTSAGTSCLDLDAYADLHSYNVIIKVFEPDWASVWKVSYFDAEDGGRESGDGERPYSWYKKNYIRVSLPTVGNASVLSDFHKEYKWSSEANNVYVTFPDEQAVVATTNVNSIQLLSGQYELVNIGVSKKALSSYELHSLVAGNSSYYSYIGGNYNAYIRGFVSDYDAARNRLTGSSVIASQEYAKQVMPLLEKNTNIVWMRNPYEYHSDIDASTTKAMQITSQAIKEFYASLYPSEGEVIEGESKVWVWAVYKPKKTVHMGMIYNPRAYKGDNSNNNNKTWVGVKNFYPDSDGIMDTNLNVYTTEYDFSFPYYYVADNTCYEFEKVVTKTFTNDYDNKSWNGALGIDSFVTAINKNQSGGSDPNGLNVLNWQNVSVSIDTDKRGTDRTPGYEDATYKTVKGRARVRGGHTYLFAVYKKKPLPEAPPFEHRKESIVSYRDTEWMTLSNTSRDALQHKNTWVNGLSAITADAEHEESKDFVPADSIPTTEFQRTDSVVPKYLVDLDYRKVDYSCTYTNVYYGAITASYTRVDEWGNKTTDYYSRYVREDVPASTAITYYSLKGATVWSPTDVTTSNYSLPDVIWEDTNHDTVVDSDEKKPLNRTVTMFANKSKLYVASQSDAATKLGIKVTGDAILEAPDFTTRESCSRIWVGEVKYNAETLDEAIANAEDAMANVLSHTTHAPYDRLPVLRAKNQKVEFKNGDGVTTTILSDNGGLTCRPSDPIDAPQASNCKTGVFSSKNNNTTKKNASDNTTQNTLIQSDGKYLYQPDTKNLQIEAAKSNGVFKSDSAVHYSMVEKTFAGIQYNSDGSKTGTTFDLIDDGNGDFHSEWVEHAFHGETQYTADVWTNGLSIKLNCNDVIINTPVVVNFKISDESMWDQSITRGAGTPLILDRPFTITTTMTGQHCSFGGYGYRDYSKYAQRVNVGGRFGEAEPEKGIPMVQLKFPFQVILQLENSYITYPANTWITVGIGERHFLLPSWVTEGDGQLIRARVLACNALANNSDLDQVEYEANLNAELVGKGRSGLPIEEDEKWHYLAIHDEVTNVVGRIYGLEIIDIGDYPAWKSTFREKDKLKGYSFKSGVCDRNAFQLGVEVSDVFPVVSGSNKTAANMGYTKTGYPIRFKVETVGDMDDMSDYVSIKPSFAVIPATGSYVKNGNNTIKVRQDVNVYYNELVNGKDKGLILVGSDADNENRHYLNLNTKDFGVSNRALDETAKVLGFKSTENYANKVTAVYTYGNIMLNPYMRTFVGLDHTTLNHKTDKIDGYFNVYDLWEQSGSNELKPDANKVSSSVQQWYGEYYLPSSSHATYYFDEMVRNSIKGTVTFNEKLLSADGRYLQVQGVSATNPSGIVSTKSEPYDAQGLYNFEQTHEYNKAYFNTNGDTISVTRYRIDSENLSVVITDTITAKVVPNAEQATDLWVNEGFLIVNFSLRTVNGGEEKLIYNTEEVYSALSNLGESGDSKDSTLKKSCNMWRTEGYVTNKSDDQGVSYDLKYGDFIIYPMSDPSTGKGTGGSSSATDDYTTGGTH